MTLRSNDLVPLFAAPPPAPRSASARQGVIVAWNRDTAENLVSVGGVIAENLPILNTSEAAILSVGDVVVLLSIGSTWGILGRFTRPGTPEAVSALSSLRTASSNVLNIDTITSTAYVDATTNPGPEVEIAVGPSGKLLIFLSSLIYSQTTAVSGGNQQPGGRMSFRLSGANTLVASTLRALRVYSTMLVNSSAAQLECALGCTRAVMLEGLNPGLTTITAQYSRENSITNISATFYDRNITAMAL